MRHLSSLLLLALSAPIALLTHAAADVPAIASTKFSDLPALLVNFEDSENILLLDDMGKVSLSKDEGKTWSSVSKIPDPVIDLLLHPLAKTKRAIAITEKTKHYLTTDAGLTWTSFNTELEFAAGGGFSFHVTELDWIIYKSQKVEKSDGWFDVVSEHAYYTKDSFKSSKPLLKYVADCSWAVSNKASASNFPKEKVFCIQWPEDVQKDGVIFRDPSTLTMVSSEKYFPSGKGDAVAFPGSSGGAPLALGSTQSFLVAVVGGDEKKGVDLYSSVDGKSFSKAYFPPDATVASRDAYTILDSSEHRIIVDILPVLSGSGRTAPYGNLYISNSEGISFTKSLAHTNRNSMGRIDFERIETEVTSGTLLANVVDNWKELESNEKKAKQITSRISFDDGARWNLLRPPQTDANGDSWTCKPSSEKSEVDAKCALHFHSRTEFHNVGKTFSTLAAPGIIIGVGNVGPYLIDYDRCDTFISTDGGLTFTNAARGPHKYEIVDTGSIIVLIPDSSQDAYKILYSTHRGAPKTWKSISVQPDGLSLWKPIATSIDPDSTSSNMIIIAESTGEPRQKNPKLSFNVIHLDFSKAQPRKCDFDPSNPSKSQDFELWTPKQPGTGGKDVCIMGEDVGYYRRKQNVDCFVGRKFKHPEIKRTTCTCDIDDFECDFGFRQDDRVDRGKDLKCVQVAAALDQPKDCPAGSQYKGSPGYRKIPGNKCTGGKTLDEKKMMDCKTIGGGVATPPKGSNPPKAYTKVVDTKVEKILYLKDSSVILLLESEGSKLWKSDDEGVTWKEPSFFQKKYPLILMGVHDVDSKRVFFVTEQSLYLTKDRLASDLVEIKTPAKFNQLNVQILDFHPTEPDYLVFVGSPGKCPTPSGCFTQVYLTLDSGKNWLNSGKPIETWATKCVWAWDSSFVGDGKLGKDAVFCSSFKDKNSKVRQDELGHTGTAANPLQLVLITNGGKDRTVVIEEGVAMFYVVDSVLVVLLEDGSSMKLVVSTDGKTFVDTEFPPNIQVEKNGFTVLESKTNGIFLDMAQSRQFGGEFGHLFKSNSNGTFYNRILEFSNRNEKGYVDFEKMRGIPGVVLANKVTNALDISAGKKHITSMISYDDGSTWTTLTPPSVDSDGNPFDCGSDCTLNIYCKISGSNSGRSSIHSSAHAAGLMVAVGSVGEQLDEYKDSNMYLTKDAGRTWSEIRKDAHKWAIGDHGAMIVMVNDEEATNTLIYSWNFGESWAEFKFAESPIRVTSVLSEPSATSLKFVLHGTSSKNSESTVITVDFGAVLPRTCDKPKKNGGDFIEWTPAGANGKDRCFLGQDISFWRRKPEADCHIGREFEDIPDKTETCACTESDFEWFVFKVITLKLRIIFSDFQFYRDDQNKCVPYTVDPLQPKNCKPGTSYDGSSGYRKIPLSKCKGGVDLSPKVKKVCGEVDTTPGNLKITTNLMKYSLSNYFYFNQSSTILIHDQAGRVYLSQDAGQSWARPADLKAEDYEYIFLDPYRADRRAFIIDEDDLTQWYTDDRGKTFKKFTVPLRASKLAAEYLLSHSTESGYLLWVGDKDCDSVVSPSCKTVAYVSTNNGGSWKEIANYVSKCTFAKEPQFSKPSKDTILCQAFGVNTGNQKNMGQRTMRKLMRSTNLGGKWETALEFTINYATSSEYLVAAQLDTGASEMKMYSSLDAVTWTRGTFEDDDKIPDYGYTLLDASTGTAFLQVFSSKETGAEMGTLYKSIDTAGSVYKISLNNVNQDHVGFTDFEKVLGIRGIGLANVVSNKEDVKSGTPKRIRSQITFNDGDLWKPLIPPKVGSDKKPYDCDKDCYLNLHHFTERSDANDLFSSESAVGFMMGVGNVGPYLKKRNDGNTFLTRDAGLTWTEVAKDAHLYEFGDQGGIILLANDEVATDEVKYSLNHGNTFVSAKISGALNGGKLRVSNIISEPYGAASTFVVFGTVQGGTRDKETAAIKLDFTSVWPRECKFVKGDDSNSDYETWSPTGSKSGDDSCMLGQQIQYYRRKSNRECHSKGFFETPITLVKTCQCTVDDFTCDIGFTRNLSNECEKNTGYVAPEPACINGQRKYTTGYVKIKNTKCQGGVTLDVGRVDSCAVPVSFGGWLGIFALVIGIPVGVSYTVIRMKSGGRIRLPVDEESFDDAMSRSKDLAAKVGYILRTTLIVVMGLVEIGLSKAREGYDWARDKYNQRSGYIPVHQTYHDVDLETDPTLLFDDE
ncbi:UNVERIFIED_CONTAM: vacuolar protein sorting/targeting protein PEP1 [Siphonaria sp. JEL0065]|nr:vacuolar protein sorting/targeting protein PEP1 [Siphonaria sp. JEL0065]